MGLLTAKELAMELGVSLNTVMRHFWKGAIPGERIGVSVRFDLQHVREAMQQRGRDAQQTAAAKRARIGGSRPRPPEPRPRVGNTGAQITPPRRNSRGLHQQH